MEREKPNEGPPRGRPGLEVTLRHLAAATYGQAATALQTTAVSLLPPDDERFARLRRQLVGTAARLHMQDLREALHLLRDAERQDLPQRFTAHLGRAEAASEQLRDALELLQSS